MNNTKVYISNNGESEYSSSVGDGLFNECIISISALIHSIIIVWLQYGRAALEVVMKSIIGHDRALVSPPSTYSGNFMEGKTTPSYIS